MKTALERLESLHPQNLARVRKEPKRSNSAIRKDFFYHRTTQSLSVAFERRGSLSERALLAATKLRQLLELEYCGLESPTDIRALTRRNRHRFEADVAPSMERLTEEARKRGLDEDGQYQYVLDWAARPDRYHTQRSEQGGVEFVQQPVLKKLDKKTAGRYFSEDVTWSETGDPELPWRSEVAGRQWRIRINEFLEDPMFTLLFDGAESLDFDNWPENWERPEVS